MTTQKSLKETGRKAESTKPAMEDFPRSWVFAAYEDAKTGEVVPKDGAYVEGTVVDIGEVEAKDGRMILKVVLDRGEENVTVWAGRKVLRDLLEENQVEKGDKIGIDYKGKAPGKNYFLYDLYVE